MRVIIAEIVVTAIVVDGAIIVALVHIMIVAIVAIVKTVANVGDVIAVEQK